MQEVLLLFLSGVLHLFGHLFLEKILSYRDYVQDVIEFKNTENIFQQGLNKNSIFGSNFRASVLAVKLDAENI